jgi:hypothetical protein
LVNGSAPLIQLIIKTRKSKELQAFVLSLEKAPLLSIFWLIRTKNPHVADFDPWIRVPEITSRITFPRA